MAKTIGEILFDQVADLPNGTSIDILVEEIRNWLDDGSEPEQLTDAMDKAQGQVYTGKAKNYFIFIQVSK